ncbi:MAG: TnpV protein [Butyrivibrio sp.]|nr:TnpV protein [Acetatifactor muris]MCM1559800.1 TnpV protein [Butyrivibrio sp.]
MDKYIFNESNSLWYELQGDYYTPCLTLPAEEERPIGLWGQRHLRYIRKHRKAIYTGLLLSGELNSYLASIDQQAEAMLSLLVVQMAQHRGVTEQLKVSDQMAWVGKMNNIRASATEIVNREIIYI